MTEAEKQEFISNLPSDVGYLKFSLLNEKMRLNRANTEIVDKSYYIAELLADIFKRNDDIKQLKAEIERLESECGIDKKYLKGILDKNQKLTAEVAVLREALQKVATCKDDDHSVLKLLGNIAHEALAHPNPRAEAMLEIIGVVRDVFRDCKNRGEYNWNPGLVIRLQEALAKLDLEEK